MLKMLKMLNELPLANALKPLLADLASSIFFAILLAVTGNIYLSTGIGIAIGIGQIVVMKLLGRPVSLMQWTSLALVIVFGGLTLYLHDPRFVMVKFAIAHVAIGAAMLQPNWMSRYLPKIVTDTLSARELTIYSAMWPVFMFAIAGIGLYVGMVMGTRAWTWFLGTINPGAPWVLFGIQYLLIRFHVRSIIRARMAAAVPAAQ